VVRTLVQELFYLARESDPQTALQLSSVMNNLGAAGARQPPLPDLRGGEDSVNLGSRKFKSNRLDALQRRQVSDG